MWIQRSRTPCRFRGALQALATKEETVARVEWRAALMRLNVIKPADGPPTSDRIDPALSQAPRFG